MTEGLAELGRVGYRRDAIGMRGRVLIELREEPYSQTPTGSCHRTDLGQLRISVVLLGGVEEGRGVAHSAAQHPLVNDLHREKLRALHVDESTARRFQPHQATARRRNPNRPSPIVGMRDRHDPCRDQRSGATRGPARREPQLPGIVGGPIDQRFGGSGETELGHGGLSEVDQTEREKLLREGRALFGRLSRNSSRSVQEGRPGNGLVVLDE